MKEVVITVETHGQEGWADQMKAILEALQEAQKKGEIDFAFNVKVINEYQVRFQGGGSNAEWLK
tara:strand:+ start:122 stop:313 length:192 start_codon:yes stop_codon:yes gene_type:complete